MTISSSTRKAGPFTGNGTTATYPFTFKIFQASDLVVVRTSLTNVDTTLALTTDYTVSLNADQNSSPGGSITLTAGNLATGLKVTMTSQVPYTQTTDLTNQGGFYPQVITTALDKLTINVQQVNEQVSRAAKLPISSTTDADVLVNNINTLATNLPTIQAVNANQTNINAVNANSTNINTVAGNNTNVTNVGGNIANVNTVAGIASNVTAVAGNATNINAVAGNATNITNVATNSTNVNTVAGSIAAINTNASNITDIQNAASNASSAAASASTATTQAGIATTQAGVATTQASSAANSAALAAASASAGLYNAVIDKNTNYTVVLADNGDLVRVDTSGGSRTITLPLISSVVDGFKVAIVKWTGDTNDLSVVRSGSNTINGQTSYSIGSQYVSATFVADLETGQWFATASGVGTTNAFVNRFSGNGSTAAFTLTGDPGSINNTAVYVAGVYQQKNTYSITGSILTFSAAPPSGTNNIEVVWIAPLAIGVPGDATVSDAKLTSSLRASITGKSVAMAIVFGG